MLEKHAIVNHELLENSSKDIETLSAIEVRQYRERGLLHISDNTYELFLALEQKRVDRVNTNMLAALQNDMVDEALADMSSPTIAVFEPAMR